MNFTINSRTYNFCNDINHNSQIRKSFNDLATKTFGLSFENWYQAGYWTNKYIPYVLLDGNTVVSNVSVNIMDCSLKGNQKRFIQLGTVMTDEKYRKQGLSKFLIERVLTEWIDKCDGIYLYANDSVTDFYPRFGFKKSQEYQYKVNIESGKENVIKLNMDNKNDVNLLFKAYQKGNPFSSLSLIDNYGLIMFYCSQFMKDNVYYCKDYDTVIVAGFDRDTMLCYDIFGTNQGNLIEILNAVAKSDTKQITFGFTPKDTTVLESVPINEEDSTFFWHSSKECIFNSSEMMFPLLSHA